MLHGSVLRNAALVVLSFLAVFGAFAEDPNPPTIHSASGAWPIRRQWTPAETQHYARWVENIYFMKTRGTVEQRTAKLERILTDPEMNLLENPQFAGEGSNPQLPAGVIRSMHHLMDCGKFTAFIPAYYAYRRALPWMSTVVTSGKGDIRTSPSNIPVGSVNSFEYRSVGEFFKNAVGWFISGNYRVNLNERRAELSDTVPVAINRTYLLPGCINYVDGHCLLLAHVSEYGELYFLNCSTTITRDIFSYNGMNTVSGRIVLTTCAGSVIVPRRDVTVTKSPSAIPSGAARFGCISHNGSGYCATSAAMRRVCVPDKYCDTTRPVVNNTGYSASTDSADNLYGTPWKRASIAPARCGGGHAPSTSTSCSAMKWSSCSMTHGSSGIVPSVSAAGRRSNAAPSTGR